MQPVPSMEKESGWDCVRIPRKVTSNIRDEPASSLKYDDVQIDGSEAN